jgi:hypothetical protein
MNRTLVPVAGVAMEGHGLRLVICPLAQPGPGGGHGS